MLSIFDQVSSSLDSLGVWTYWILGITVMLETVVVTSIFFPGTFLVITGGVMAQQGIISYTELAAFVSVGAFVGSEISYRLGNLTARKLSSRQNLVQSPHAKRALELFLKHGGFAVLIARFLGPLAGFVPFAAAMAGQKHHHFTTWNIISSIAFGVIMPSIGYFFGSAVA